MRRAAIKPTALSLIRNLNQDNPSTSAECTAWSIDLSDDQEGVECGRCVELPALCFDEGDGPEIRKLAAWLEQSARWIEDSR